VEMQLRRGMDALVAKAKTLLENNNIIILIDGALYHKLKEKCNQLTKVRTALFHMYMNLETEFTSRVLDLTLTGHELIKEISQMIEDIEEQWNEGDIDLNKYILAQAILCLDLDGDVVIDIDDLELLANHPEYVWICLYIVTENNIKICHYAGWKSKQEALLFAMKTPGCGKDYVINRFNLKMV
ncbi:MAG: hypothetical protein K2G70_03930, partial [Turicibacter sp.]|nr:hypothetical protein [Turicibacter sp.]